MTVREKSPLDLLALVPEHQDLRPIQHHNKIHRPPLKLQHVPDFNFKHQAGLTLGSNFEQTKNCSVPTENDGRLINDSSSLRSEAVNNQTYPLGSPAISPRTKFSTLYTSHHKRSCHQHNSTSNNRSEIDNQMNNRPQRTYILPEVSPATGTKSSIALPTVPPTSTLNPLARSFRSFRPLPSPLLRRQHQNQNHYLSNSYLSPYHMTNLLARWHSDKKFMATCQKRERTDPFPEIDMNQGWNRSRCEGKLAFEEEKDIFPVLRGGAQEKLDVLGALRGWSWQRQGEGIQWVLEDLRGVFDMVFVGDGGRNGERGCAWAREPGSWWGADKRLGLQMSCRGTIFLDELEAQTSFLESQLLSWTESQTRQREVRNQNHVFQPAAVYRKRSSDNALGGQIRITKRCRSAWANAKRFQNDSWRKRRREQERKAGRWLDGTHRMWRVWDEFFWVLDAGDHRWEKSYPQVVSGRNIWG